MLVLLTVIVVGILLLPAMTRRGKGNRFFTSAAWHQLRGSTADFKSKAAWKFWFFIAFVLVHFYIYGPDIASFTVVPVAQRTVLPLAQAIGAWNFQLPQSPAALPQAEQPPVVRGLNTGFQGYDKPAKDAKGSPVVVFTDVGGHTFDVIGRWGCWEKLPYVSPFVQVRLLDVSGRTDFWVLRGSIPLPDTVLKELFEGAHQHKTDADCN